MRTPFDLHRSSGHLAAAVLLVAALTSACQSVPFAGTPTPATSPAQRAGELLSADRAWSAQATRARFPEALATMFTDSVRMPLRDRVLVGRTAVLAALVASPDTGATVRWVPIRAGLAADGQQGFTAGVQYLTRANGERVTARYLAYWVRETNGVWKVMAWRRRPLANVVADTTQLPSLLPVSLRGLGPLRDIAAHRVSLISAEQGFSDTANRIGVGAAFALLGDDDALNMGRPDQPTFVRGAQAIASLVAGTQPLDAPSTIVWKADDALVASSGDLGITFGVIRPRTSTTGSTSGGAAFFTIWRKSSRDAPWRYVAE